MTGALVPGRKWITWLQCQPQRVPASGLPSCVVWSWHWRWRQLQGRELF